MEVLCSSWSYVSVFSPRPVSLRGFIFLTVGGGSSFFFFFFFLSFQLSLFSFRLGVLARRRDFVVLLLYALWEVRLWLRLVFFLHHGANLAVNMFIGSFAVGYRRRLSATATVPGRWVGGWVVGFVHPEAIWSRKIALAASAAWSVRTAWVFTVA